MYADGYGGGDFIDLLNHLIMPAVASTGNSSSWCLARLSWNAMLLQVLRLDGHSQTAPPFIPTDSRKAC